MYICRTITTKPYTKHTLTPNTQSYRFPTLQQQKALDEFDFLFQMDQPNNKTNKRHSPRMELPPPPPPTANPPAPSSSRSTSSLPQERPYVTQSPEVYHRPVLSMPPVILMGGGGTGGAPGFASLFGSHSVPPSPIIEMPPSPAPSHMMVVEFPDDDDDFNGEDLPDDAMGVHLRDTYQSQMVHEVRTQSQHIFIPTRPLISCSSLLHRQTRTSPPALDLRLFSFLSLWVFLSLFCCCCCDSPG